jgi:uncharacterized membrane protein YcaP (DUF421 family)
MDSVLRALLTYAFVWLIFRIAGKRSLAQITTFDAVLLLIISEATQGALLNGDNSITNSFLVILTLLSIDVFLSCLKIWFPTVEKIVDGTPCVLVERGKVYDQGMKNERVQIDDILNAGRELQGLANMDEIDYAVLEQSGGISIVPKRAGGA